jgi:hypothetical protein
MDIKTVEFKSFADQKPGTYVIAQAPLNPSTPQPLNPAMGGFPMLMTSGRNIVGKG